MAKADEVANCTHNGLFWIQKRTKMVLPKNDTLPCEMAKAHIQATLGPFCLSK